MTHKQFFISDTHFSHKNILSFETAGGVPVRDFESVEEMNEVMIHNWNSVVRPCDIVYHLGDVSLNDPTLEMLSRLNGRKRLIRGNHDIGPTKVYMEHFEEIYGVKGFYRKGFKWVCTHVPIHPDCLERWGMNVHGHLHEKLIDDPRYINVSVEQINYTPMEREELCAIIEKRLGLRAGNVHS